MVSRFAVVLFGLILASPGVLTGPSCAANTIPDLGSAADFALLGLNNAKFVIQGSVVVGDIGIGQGGTATNSSGAVFGSGIQYSSGQITNSGFISGGLTVDSTELTNANADAVSAYNAAVANTATQTISSITTDRTITGNGGLNVISIGTVTLNNDNITLNGTSSDIFVLKVSGNFSMSNNSSILLGAGVTAENVLIVFTGSGRTISVGITGSAAINGTLLAPSSSTNWVLTDGTFNGEIITGTRASGTYINLNNIVLKGVPFRAVPEPSSLVLTGIASAGLLSLSRLRRQCTPRAEA